MKILYLQSWFGVTSKIFLDELKWSRQKGSKMASGVFTNEEVESLKAAAQSLLAIKPKRSYGSYRCQSDPTETTLNVTVGSEKIEIGTISDPKDPQPQELYDFVDLLMAMTAPQANQNGPTN